MQAEYMTVDHCIPLLRFVILLRYFFGSNQGARLLYRMNHKATYCININIYIHTYIIYYTICGPYSAICGDKQRNRKMFN